MQDYQHTVQYYETDKMGITHHSNYVRWMEEARVDYLSRLGWGYERFEALGVVSPVVQLSCDYKSSTTFADVVTIHLSLAAYRGVKLTFHYVMKNQAGVTVCEASSTHCFLNAQGRPISVARQFPEFHEILLSLLETP